MKKISVIVPVYNEQRDIADCLSSLQKQSYSNLEIIIVDDGSTDKTLEIVKKFPVKIITQNHLGAGAARNLGASQAKGDIYVFVDADMTFDFNFLTRLVQPILSKKTIGTFSKEEYVSNPQQIWAKCWNINHNLPEHKMHPDSYPNYQPVFRAIDAHSFKKVQGFDLTGYNDDWSLSRKLKVQATAAIGAKFFHRNPDSLLEVWYQASWIAKRPYKLGLVGQMITIIRHSLPMSLLAGIYKSIIYLNPYFFVFKIVYDLAIITHVFSKKLYK